MPEITDEALGRLAYETAKARSTNGYLMRPWALLGWPMREKWIIGAVAVRGAVRASMGLTEEIAK